MQIKKNLTNNDFLKLIFREIYLLILILAIAFSILIYFSIKKNNEIKETYSKATITLPIPYILIIDKIIGEDLLRSESDLPYLHEKFNTHFYLKLISDNNLQNFLDLEINSTYDQFFKQKKMNIKDYFYKNNLEITSSPTDSKSKFSFVLSLKHPLDLDAKNFLISYIEFTKIHLINEKIKSQVDKANKIMLILKKILEIRQDLELEDKYVKDDRIQSFETFLDQFLKQKNNNDISKIFLDNILELNNKNLKLKIKFLEFIIKNIDQFEYNFTLDIKTMQYEKENSLFKNVILSIVLSFVIFFSIIIFKQVYKDFINK